MTTLIAPKTGFPILPEGYIFKVEPHGATMAHRWRVVLSTGRVGLNSANYGPPIDEIRLTRQWHWKARRAAWKLYRRNFTNGTFTGRKIKVVESWETRYDLIKNYRERTDQWKD